MIKPIVYHSFEEKAPLEKELMSKLSLKERSSVLKALMDIFNKANKRSAASQSKGWIAFLFAVSALLEPLLHPGHPRRPIKIHLHRF